jgi:hypothetical protein
LQINVPAAPMPARATAGSGQTPLRIGSGTATGPGQPNRRPNRSRLRPRAGPGCPRMRRLQARP